MKLYTSDEVLFSYMTPSTLVSFIGDLLETEQTALLRPLLRDAWTQLTNLIGDDAIEMLAKAGIDPSEVVQ